MVDDIQLKEEVIGAVASVAIKPPKFTETNPKAWFAIMEAQFNISKITTTRAKFYHSLAGLDSDIVSRIPPNILELGEYEPLKEAIVTTYEKTKPEILDKLMGTSSVSGRPSVFLTELQVLASKIGASEEIIRHKFIDSLPATIRPILHSQKELSITQLGKLADELQVVFKDKTENSAVVHAVQPRNEFRNRNYRSREGSSNREDIPPGLRPFSRNQRPKVCRAHLYFGGKARNCKPWCTWPTKKDCMIQPSSRNASPNRQNNSEN